jgi:hypothetical protein
VLVSQLPVPSVIPVIRYQFNEYLAFDFNWAAIHAGLYYLYYLALEPVGAVSTHFPIPKSPPYRDSTQLLYGPQLALSLLTATAFAGNADNIGLAGVIHLISWVAQFLGHGLAEKRAPALLDNLIGGKLSPSSFTFWALHFLQLIDSRRTGTLLRTSRSSI